MVYRVRALGTGDYCDSDWSVTRTFNVCPMDVDNDGDIGPTDRVFLKNNWLGESGSADLFYPRPLPAAADTVFDENLETKKIMPNGMNVNRIAGNDSELKSTPTSAMPSAACSRMPRTGTTRIATNGTMYTPVAAYRCIW